MTRPLYPIDIAGSCRFIAEYGLTSRTFGGLLATVRQIRDIGEYPDEESDTDQPALIDEIIALLGESYTGKPIARRRLRLRHRRGQIGSRSLVAPSEPKARPHHLG